MKGLPPKTQKNLILSVGTQRSIRPLTPVEVAEAIEISLASGSSIKELASELDVDTSMLGYFRRLLKLSPEVRYLVDWKKTGKLLLNTETASLIARLSAIEEQQKVAEAFFRNNLAREEVRQIVQLRERSDKTISDCISEVLQMRPNIVKRYILIGAIISEKVREALQGMTQHERDQLLKEALTSSHPELPPWDGKLGVDRFTVIGDEAFGAAVQRLPGGFEQSINTCLEEGV